ncbi:hypothetical protein K490DRAFT_46313 [Saccharata proteae CBS 121410]|uniref:Mgs207 protein n=1 Tax=Saccharata proteae CBS 121410 TaxID=1314787 RepID=A0A9P4HS49_9PEZI|nr:hypothetical protein K490DRAFT_46313 [Saccharata proteae CBS 121410]
MFTIPTFRLPSLSSVFGSSHPAVTLPSVPIHDVETAAEKRPRTLKHLIRANHANHSIIYHNLQFHNHTPHILGSAYILGDTHEHLGEIYDRESEELEPWHDSPNEIAKHDWRDFLGKREYQRAFVDFFEDQLVLYSYDWRAMLHDYLFEGKEPLINSMIVGGLAHSLIHLGYAFELSSRTVAMEALGLAACFHNDLHKYLDNPSYIMPSPNPTTSLLDLLSRVASDKRFDNLFEHPGSDNIDPLFEKHEAAVLEFWNAWNLKEPKKQFEESQRAAVGLLHARHQAQDQDKGQYDFFIVHLLTGSHAVRILLPLIPVKFHVGLVRQWWLFTIAVYIAQLRPVVDLDAIEAYDLNGRGWEYVVDKALKGPYSLDAHYVKACRAMKEAAETWGDETSFYLKAAVKFATEFDGWGGFGLAKEEEEHEQHLGREGRWRIG